MKILKEMAKDATTFFVFFLEIENLLNEYDRLAHKIYFWTPEVQRSAAEIAKIALGSIKVQFYQGPTMTTTDHRKY